jgi:hypothetical protein
MKQILLAAIFIIGANCAVTAQESPTQKEMKEKRNFYFGLGVAANGDYKINDKLNDSGLPDLSPTVPEISFGFNYMWTKTLMDIEVNSSYYRETKDATRIIAMNAGVKVRVHYVPVNKEKFFVSGGLDVSYLTGEVSLYNKYNEVDLNDLNPLNYAGQIHLTNDMVYVGPSAAFGFLQDTNWPLRVNVGYEWNILNSKWGSEFADVNNTVKESGHGRFYAKLILYL